MVESIFAALGYVRETRLAQAERNAAHTQRELHRVTEELGEAYQLLCEKISQCWDYADTEDGQDETIADLFARLMLYETDTEDDLDWAVPDPSTVVLEGQDKPQVVYNVHAPECCEGEGCAIHHPSDHPLKDAPRVWGRDNAYLLERVCTHRAAHPDVDHLGYMWRTQPRIAADQQEHTCCEGQCCGIEQGHAALETGTQLELAVTTTQINDEPPQTTMKVRRPRRRRAEDAAHADA